MNWTMYKILQPHWLSFMMLLLVHCLFCSLLPKIHQTRFPVTSP